MSAKKNISLILLVDDDHSVRRVCRIALERAGFGVIEAASGHAAQIAWNEHAHAIDMLVTDFEMPGMTGLQLSALLRTAKPSLKILLMSGFVRETVPDCIGFLSKPFLPGDLTDAVSRCLLSKPVC